MAKSKKRRRIRGRRMVRRGKIINIDSLEMRNERKGRTRTEQITDR